MAPIVPIVLLILLVAYGLRSRVGLTRSVGLPLLVGGLVGLIPVLVYQGAIGAHLTMGPMRQVPAGVRTEFTRAFGVLLGEIFNPMAMESVAVSVIGLVVIVSGMMPARKKSAASA